jgi:hypothetical protein
MDHERAWQGLLNESLGGEEKAALGDIAFWLVDGNLMRLARSWILRLGSDDIPRS